MATEDKLAMRHRTRPKIDSLRRGWSVDMYTDGTYGGADGVLWRRRVEGLDWVNASRADVFREQCEASSAAFAEAR